MTTQRPDGRRTRRATSADVAHEAGVSRTTVSFVLNDRADQTIPEETRRRVLQAAAKLSYAPSPEAQALSRGHSDLVLLYLPPTLPLTSDVAALVEHLAASFTDAGLTMVAHPWTRGPAEDVWAAVTPAAVLAWQLDDIDAEQMRRNGVQVVASLTGSDPIGRWVTGTRELEIARAQVDHLAAAGHRHLGYAVARDERMGDASRLRHSALATACAERGLPEPVSLRLPVDLDGATAALATWRAQAPAATAICAHDTLAGLAVLAGMRQLGLRAPHDLAVIGVNDSATAALTDPPLTMVAVDAAASARYVVDTITSMLHTDLPTPATPHGITTVVGRLSV